MASKAAAIALLLVGGTSASFEYPLFKQCDEQWGSDIMDTKTICQVGCLMSSTSMGLAGAGIPITNSTSSTPGTLNSWLQSHGGYDGSNDFIEESLPSLDPSRVFWPPDAMHRENDLPYGTVCDYVEVGGRVVIANVRDGGHFVLITGCGGDGDTFLVNDPGFAVEEYSFKQDVVGYRIFDMLRL